jgi:hypothetical protein
MWKYILSGTTTTDKNQETFAALVATQPWPHDHAVRLCVEPSTRGITTKAVVSDEMARTTAQVVSTASRADDTPVSSDTTTNTFRGTRNNADS